MKKKLLIVLFTGILFSFILFTACNLNVQTAENPLNGNWGGEITLRITGSFYTLNYGSYSEIGSCSASSGVARFLPNSGGPYTCIYQLTGNTLRIDYSTAQPTDKDRPNKQYTLTKQ